MEKFDLDKIKDLIAQKYNWGSPSNWTNFHFKELSKEIQEATGDRISEETLKRIFGKRKVDSDKYQPQAFSQMLLVRFVEGFEKDKKQNLVLSKTFKILFTILGTIIIVGLIILYFHEKPVNFKFACENPEDFYPFTAVFHYDVSEIKDSVFVQFRDGEESYLPPAKSRVNYFYMLGGRHKVYLFTREKILDSLYVAANTRDWQGGFFPDNEPGLFEPFIDQKIFLQDDYFYALPEILLSEGIDLKERYYTAYKYFSTFNKSMDSLTLETRLQNNANTGSYLCYDIGLSLVGESDGVVDFKFTQPKCSRYATLRVSEKHLSGEYNDLSALSVDMSEWLDVKMKTQQGKMSLYLGDKQVFKEEYENELGNLVGIIIYFFGTGKIDYLRLKDLEGNLFFQDEFSKSKNRNLNAERILPPLSN